MSAPYTIHPDMVNFVQSDLAAIAADPAITERVRGYAKEALVVRMLEEYQAAVDAKYATVEQSPEWHAADVKCDRLCWEYVVAVQAFFPNADEAAEWL